MVELTNRDAMLYIYEKTNMSRYDVHLVIGESLKALLNAKNSNEECNPKIKYFYDKIVFLESLGIQNIRFILVYPVKGEKTILNLISENVDFENDFLVICKILQTVNRANIRNMTKFSLIRDLRK